MALPYPGNIPSNVSKDAKYSVISGPDGHEVRLVYRLSSREKALLTTDGHPDLVDMVNDVKLEMNGAAGGAFYINEFYDVLVPTTKGECYFAGTYQRLLEFDLGEGQTIGPRAPAGLEPGAPWAGPHVGIRYRLKAGGRDISYTRVSGNREREYRLSDEHGADEAAALAKRLSVHKGDAGGRIYLNEAGEFFSPPPGPDQDFVYLGSLDEDLWFPPPEVPRP